MTMLVGPSRISEIAAESMTPEQTATFEALRAGRGRIPTPYKIWLHSPMLALALERLGTFLNTQSSLTAREIELTTILTAQYWHGDYVFAAHLEQAAKLGFDDATLEALRTRRRPTFADSREDLVYQLVSTAQSPQPLDDQTFEASVRALGHRGLADLFALVGYYTAVALAMKTYRVPTPGG